MYELRFDEDDRGRQRYEICHQSIVLTQKGPAVADWSDVVDLLKKLKAAGRPGRDKIGKTVLYDLKDGGATIHLENSEYKQLLDFIKQPLWRPEILEDVQEVVAWLEGLKKVSGSPRQEIRNDLQLAKDASETTGATRD